MWVHLASHKKGRLGVWMHRMRQDCVCRKNSRSLILRICFLSTIWCTKIWLFGQRQRDSLVRFSSMKLPSLLIFAMAVPVRAMLNATEDQNLLRVGPYGRSASFTIAPTVWLNVMLNLLFHDFVWKISLLCLLRYDERKVRRLHLGSGYEESCLSRGTSFIAFPVFRLPWRLQRSFRRLSLRGRGSLPL